MNKYFYDLHVHSCLSPCGDDDNTPNNLAGMATLNGIQIMALTDHNTCQNCPAFFKAAKRYGIIAIAGMELTTSEEIHVICLFDDLEKAMEFDKEVSARRIKVPNRPDIFGHQYILDGEDNIVSEEPNLLSVATTISLEEVPSIVQKYDGVCYPAHIDRHSNGAIAVLGAFPETPHFDCVEFHKSEKAQEYIARYGLESKLKIISSDAHYLTDLREDNVAIELDDEPYSSELVRKNLIKRLKGIK